MRAPGRARVRRAFGVTIRALRRQKNISQETLALDAKVSRRYMSSIEQGRHNLSVDLVDRLVSALKINWITFSTELEAHLKSNNNR
jgi:transcriptional regulator with XRE-family HTH domain